MHMISPFTHILCASDVTNPQLWQVHDEVSDDSMHNSEVVALNNSKGNRNENMYKTHNAFGLISKWHNAILTRFDAILLIKHYCNDFNVFATVWYFMKFYYFVGTTWNINNLAPII